MTTTINVKELLNNYLEQGKILIAVDSNIEGTVLPDYLKNSIQVKLNLSHKFDTTVFEIDEDKVTVDLSFSGKKFMCSIPFAAIYYVAMAEDPLNGVEIIENMPFELLKLSYEITLAAEAEREIEDKDIDFLSNIPAEKADSINKNLGLDERAAELTRRGKPMPSKSDAIDKMFDEFMELVKHDGIRESLSDISGKIHSTKARTKKKATNEIKLNKKHFNKDKK